jgi:hypothetical protein
VINCFCRQCLSKLAFKRVRKATGTFRALIMKVPARKRKRWFQKYAKQGLFDYRSQTPRVRCSGIITLISLANTTTYPVWLFISLGQPSTPAFLASLTECVNSAPTINSSSSEPYRDPFQLPYPLLHSGAARDNPSHCLAFPLLSFLMSLSIIFPELVLLQARKAILSGHLIPLLRDTLVLYL